MCNFCSKFAADLNCTNVCIRVETVKEMKNIAFIINPISGSKEIQKEKKKLPKLIMQTLDDKQWLPNITFTEYAGHGTELAYSQRSSARSERDEDSAGNYSDG